MNCKSCGAGVPAGAVTCPACGVKAGSQEGPSSGAGAQAEYMLVLQSVWDGREEEVAAKIAELAGKDVETAMGYLRKLPLTLGRKFSREKAVRTKEMLEAAGGLVSATPPLDDEEESSGFGDLPAAFGHEGTEHPSETEHPDTADDYAPPLVSSAQPASFGAEDAKLPPPVADEQPITMAEPERHKPAEAARPKPSVAARPGAGPSPANAGPRGRQPEEPASGGTNYFVWVAVPLAIVVAACIVLVIAFPELLNYKAKARQTEARTNLMGLSAKQAEFLSANGRYAASFVELGWSPAPAGESGIFYSYFLGGAEVVPGDGGIVELPEGVEAGVETFHYRAVAAGNIDKDDTIDVWVLADSGQPENVVNDVRE